MYILYAVHYFLTLVHPALEEPSLLECVIQCYHHLLSLLPNTTSFLTSCSSLVAMVIASDQEKLSTKELLSRYVYWLKISQFLSIKHLPDYYFVLADYFADIYSLRWSIQHSTVKWCHMTRSTYSTAHSPSYPNALRYVLVSFLYLTLVQPTLLQSIEKSPHVTGGVKCMASHY